MMQNGKMLPTTTTQRREVSNTRRDLSGTQTHASLQLNIFHVFCSKMWKGKKRPTEHKLKLRQRKLTLARVQHADKRRHKLTLACEEPHH